jgi:hypothetical protein
MYFTIICVVSSVQTIAAGSGIRERCRRTVSLRRLSMATEPSDLAVCVDESGEDYLYPAKNFHKVELPAAVRRAVFQAA